MTIRFDSIRFSSLFFEHWEVRLKPVHPQYYISVSNGSSQPSSLLNCLTAIRRSFAVNPLPILPSTEFRPDPDPDPTALATRAFRFRPPIGESTADVMRPALLQKTNGCPIQLPRKCRFYRCPCRSSKLFLQPYAWPISKTCGSAEPLIPSMLAGGRDPSPDGRTDPGRAQSRGCKICLSQPFRMRRGGRYGRFDSVSLSASKVEVHCE
jgi:hypothetical protein